MDFDIMTLMQSWLLVSLIVTIALCVLFYVTAGKENAVVREKTKD